MGAARIAVEEAAAAEAETISKEEAAEIASARIAAEEAKLAAAEIAVQEAANIENKKQEDGIKLESEPCATKTNIKSENEKKEQQFLSEVFHLYVHKARNLENKDILGKSDPYVHVTFGSQEVRSPTVDNSLNPEWQFHTKLATNETSSQSVEVRIFDDDFGKSEPQGKITLALKDKGEAKQIQHQWLPLEGAVSGEVQVSLVDKELDDVELKSENNKESEKGKPNEAISSPGFTTRIEVKSDENTPLEESSEGDEELCRENLRTISDLVQRKLSRGSDASESKYFIST